MRDNVPAWAVTLDNLAQRRQALADAELSDYRTRLAMLEGITPHLAPPQRRMLTVLRIMNRTYDENAVSDLLAYMLNPEVNGIGIEPLRRLVEQRFEQQLPDTADVQVEREHTFASGGRIDLLITINGSLVLGIENKVFAQEGQGQTSSYARSMASEFPDAERLHLFLTRDGAKAQSSRFVPISYGVLVQILRQVRVDWMADVHKAVLWEDFLTHMEEHLDMTRSKPTPSEQVMLYAEHHEMIRDLQRQYDTYADELFQYVIGRLQARYMPPTWDYWVKGERAYQQIRKPEWLGSKINAHFEPGFGRDLLWQHEMDFYVDVEGQRSSQRQMLEICDSMADRWAKAYQERGIIYRPEQRKHAIAFKSYALDPDQDPADSILAAVDEMMFISEMIDEALARVQA